MEENHSFTSPATPSMVVMRKILKKEKYSLLNRLKSINYDASFVARCTEKFSYPTVATLRCGLWYQPFFDATCYFKSTDGHAFQESFSTHRLNLHLLDLIYSEGGCILVDSTREGKRFPDSLSKVVPIWCATINSFVFNSPFPSEDCLQTRFKEVWTTVYPLPLERWHESMWLPSWLSYSDVSRITEKLQNFVTTLSNVMDDSTARCIRTKLRKFLLPLWVCPSNETQAITFIQRLQEDFLLSFHFYFIICVCASSTDPSPPPSDFFYIQGAADDQEMWNSARLTPSLFWANMNALLHCQDDLQCIKKIEAYVAAHRNNQSTREPSASLDSETMDIYKQPLSSIGGSSTGVFVCDGATAHKILKNLYEKTLPIHPHSPGYPKFHLIIRVGRKLFSLENPEITDSMTEPFYTVYKEYDCTYSKRPKDGKLWSDLLNTVLTWIWQAHYDFFRKNGKEEYPSILIFAHHEDDFTCVQFVVCACLVLFFGTSHPLIAAERTLSTKSKEEQTSIFCPRSSSFSFFMKGFPREILPMKPALTKTDLHRVANTLQTQLKNPAFPLPRRTMNELMRYFNRGNFRASLLR